MARPPAGEGPGPVTLQEMLAHPPLVIAWVWEVVCILGAVAAYLLTENVAVMVALILAGALPFVVVLIRFSMERQAGRRPPKAKDIVS